MQVFTLFYAVLYAPFYADPHPGNVSVDTNGRLLFYDFGMMGQIIPDVRERLLDVFYGIYRKDSSQVIRNLVELGVIKPTGDTLSIRRAINYFLENLTQQTERQETIQVRGRGLGIAGFFSDLLGYIIP
jgi:predicted unusual protein kinase regulating ubiquinone biosynthesis (AarF/ABC1/UbiB family)